MCLYCSSQLWTLCIETDLSAIILIQAVQWQAEWLQSKCPTLPMQYLLLLLTFAFFAGAYLCTNKLATTMSLISTTLGQRSLKRRETGKVCSGVSTLAFSWIAVPVGPRIIWLSLADAEPLLTATVTQRLCLLIFDQAVRYEFFEFSSLYIVVEHTAAGHCCLIFWLLSEHRGDTHSTSGLFQIPARSVLYS